MSVEIVTLRDSDTGSQARVLASTGFNCFEFEVDHDGRRLDVLWAEPGFEQGDKRASGGGIPLLFPYPGRLRGQSLTWHDHQYSLEGDDHLGNALHGYVLTRPWQVIDQSENRVVGQFQASRDDDRLLGRWPADFRITATYELAGNTLESSFLIENPDEKPLPFGFGTHPYFRVPLGGADAGQCRVSLPVSSRWEMNQMLPTGRQLALDAPDRYRSGLPFSEMEFDDIFAGLDFEMGWCTARIIDPDSGRWLILRFEDVFRECVVYTPPHREAICIEPYTCVPNSPELQNAGLDSGLRILQPGESLSARVIMQVE